MKNSDEANILPHFRNLESRTKSSAVESYLKLIFELSEESSSISKRLSTSQISDAMNVRASSVTSMIQKLAEGDVPLVDYKKHQGVLLTPAGKLAALDVIRNHRLLEMFLYRVMGFSWDEVHKEALRLQHAISQEFTDRMAKILGNPEFDPHGAPIPDKNLSMPVANSIRLSKVSSTGKIKILRIPDDDPTLLKHWKRHEFIPGVVCKVIEVSGSGQAATWRIELPNKAQRLSVPVKSADKIYISYD